MLEGKSTTGFIVDSCQPDQHHFQIVHKDDLKALLQEAGKEIADLPDFEEVSLIVFSECLCSGRKTR